MSFVYILQQNLETEDKIIGVYDVLEEPKRLVTEWMNFEEHNNTDIKWGWAQFPDILLAVDDVLGTVYMISKKELNKTTR